MLIAAVAPLAWGWVVGCSSPDSGGDIVGPFTGELHRYYVDAIEIPRDGSEALAFAADLDGDGKNDNQLGNVTAVLSTTSDLTADSDDMIKSGAIASIVEVQADDLVDDPAVGVTFYGDLGEPFVVIGGEISRGAFLSNRTRDTHAAGMATVHLPIYTNADPLVLPLEGVELAFVPDDVGGLHVIVRGGIRQEAARAAAYTGLIQMFETEPQRHLVFARGIDTNRDAVISRAEVDESLIALLVAADVDLDLVPGSSPDAVSVAFGVHLSSSPPFGISPNHCRDRRVDSDESDVDCGGSCQKCWDNKTCVVAADCQSNACAGGPPGSCSAATCSDGVRDGYESDIDCGGVCGGCGTGKVCAADSDCVSSNCDGGIATLGSCR